MRPCCNVRWHRAYLFEGAFLCSFGGKILYRTLYQVWEQRSTRKRCTHRLQNGIWKLKGKHHVTWHDPSLQDLVSTWELRSGSPERLYKNAGHLM